MTPIDPSDPTDDTDQEPGQAEAALVADDLIEEVSIDGMCGVY